MRRTGKVTAGILTGLLCFAAVAGSLSRSQAQDGQPPSQKDNAPAQGAGQEKAMPEKGGGINSEEKTVRDVYARLMRYHTAARDEASADRGVIYKAADYITFGVNDVKTGSIEEIFDRPLQELVTPRGGEIINLKPNYLRVADGLAHASYDAAWETLSDEGKPDQTASPTALQAGGGKYKDAVKYTSYEVTVSLEGKRRTYRAMALHFNPAGADGMPDTEILDNITSDMNGVLSERSPRVRSPWARYVRSNLHNAIVDSIREKEQAGLPLIPADAPIGYLPGDDIEAANSVPAIAADSCEPEPPPLTVTISDVKAVIKGGFADFQITLNPSPSNVSVTLDLSTISGAGQALFDVNNSSSLTISQSSTVRIKGVNESSAVNNIKLMARALFFPLATKNFTVIKVELKEIAFGGDSYVPIRKDDNTDYFTAPHWQDNSSPLDGDADDPGDRKYPVAYVRNNTVTASVTLSIHPSVSLDGVNISVRGDGPGNLDFPAKSVTTSAGSSGDRLVIDDLRTPTNISSAVECIDCFPPPAPPEGIKWEVSVAQPTGATTWKEVGTSRNRVYVLLDPPVGFSTIPPFTRPLLETIVHLACKGAKGKSTTNDVFTAIWTVFSAPNLPLGESPIKTADESRSLKYYNPKDTPNTASRQLINAGNGQCGSWGRLMIDSARAHGIDSLRFPVVSRIDDVTTMNLGFLVKDWTFTTGPGKSGIPEYPYINVIASKADYDTPSKTISARHTYTYKDVTDVIGIPGKGSLDPASIFNNHQFIEYTNPTTGVTTWYDPSYGVTYTGATEAARLSSVAAKIDGLYRLGLMDIDEFVLDIDANGDGDKTDFIPSHPVLIIKKKPAGTILKLEYQTP